MPRSKTQSEKIRAESREQILSTARKLFAERGYEGCRVSDIAHHSNMSQGNLYWYFSSKEEILKAVLKEGFEALGSMMAETAARAGSSLEKLDDLIERYIAFGREEAGMEFITISFTLTAQGGIERFRELGFDTRQIGFSYHQSVSAVIAQGQQEGLIQLKIDPNLAATFFFSLFNGMMFLYGNDWINIPKEEIRAAALRLLGVQVEEFPT
jgi:TetR/AcrR family transcriptional regulator, fatty acid metabolism regulator protein